MITVFPCKQVALRGRGYSICHQWHVQQQRLLSCFMREPKPEPWVVMPTVYQSSKTRLYSVDFVTPANSEIIHSIGPSQMTQPIEYTIKTAV